MLRAINDVPFLTIVIGMGLKKAPHWTDLYYDIVEHYFWRPQDIGRQSVPDKPARKWAHWRQKLANQETPLNHMLDLLLHMADQSIIDALAATLLSRPVKNLELVALTDNTIERNITEPDIILSNGEELVFVEMSHPSNRLISLC